MLDAQAGRKESAGEVGPEPNSGPLSTGISSYVACRYAETGKVKGHLTKVTAYQAGEWTFRNRNFYGEAEKGLGQRNWMPRPIEKRVT